MSARSQKLLEMGAKQKGVAAPNLRPLPPKKRKVPPINPRDDDECASVCSKFTPSESAILNAPYLEEISLTTKVNNWSEGKSYNDPDPDPMTPKKKEKTKKKTYGLVPYTPPSERTTRTHTSVTTSVSEETEDKENSHAFRQTQMKPPVASQESERDKPISKDKTKDKLEKKKGPLLDNNENKDRRSDEGQNRNQKEEKIKNIANLKVTAPLQKNNLKRTAYTNNRTTLEPDAKKAKINASLDEESGTSKPSQLSAYQALRNKYLEENKRLLESCGVAALPPETPNQTDKGNNLSGKQEKNGNKQPLSSKNVRALLPRAKRNVARKIIQDTVPSDDSDENSDYLEESGDENSSKDEAEESDYSSDSDSEYSDDDTNENEGLGLSQNSTPNPTHTLSEEEEEELTFHSHSPSPLSPRHEEYDNSESRPSSEPEDIETTTGEDRETEGTNEKRAITGKEKKAQNKLLRNSGKMYTQGNGVVKSSRKRKRPHVCKDRKCHEVVTDEVGERIFKEYWQQSSHDKRVAYIAARTERKGIKRHRSRQDNEKRKKSQNFDYFLDIEGERVQVCRSTFKGTLGETDRFVRNVTENKKKSFSGITSDDRRGKHTPPHALSLTNKAQSVKKHIESFPAYVSHYCRAKTKDQKYLAPDLTISQMHRLYKPPQTDVCDLCTTLEIGKKNAATDEKKSELERKHEVHLRRAEKAFDLKRAAKKAAKEDPTKRVLVCDLQQCLPTPHLTCKKVYYSRQLYVLNFTVYDSTTGLTYCYMWDETEGKRGSNEISTCLLKHIMEEVPDNVEHLTIFTDCCSGQNRNSTMSMMMFIALQEHPSLQTVDHIFLIPGHTFMPEVDNKHAIIEKYKRRLQKVNVPDEWYSIVHKAGMTDPENFPEGKFKVKHMTSFYDIAALAADQLVKRKSCTDKEAFSYLETHWWRYEKISLGVVKVKASFTEEAEFRKLSFLRKGVRSDRLPMLLPCLQKMSTPVPISAQKKKDLLSLIEYLEEEYHSFYINLPSSAAVKDLHPKSRGVVED